MTGGRAGTNATGAGSATFTAADAQSGQTVQSMV